MTDRNSTVQDQFTPDEIIKLHSIKKTTYYERLKFLGIKAHKDGEGKAYLDSEQVELLEKLDLHVKATGKMEGFELSSVENKEVETSKGDSSSLGKGELAIAQKSSQIVSPATVIETEIPETQPDFENVGAGELDRLMRRAAEIKAQSLVTPELVMLNLASQMTEEDLPEDLKQKVEEVREAANPKQQPAQLATNLLAQYRAKVKGGN